MNEPNIPLLRKVMDHIAAHPNEWHQGSWASHLSVEEEQLDRWVSAVDRPNFVEQVEWKGQKYRCKTAYCFAGHAAVMSGAAFQKFNEITWDGSYVTTPEGDTAHARSYAVEVLNLSETDACILFNGGNSLDDLQDYVAQLEEHGEITNVR